MAGSSIGDILTEFAVEKVEPRVKESVDEEYHKWIRPVLCNACRAVAVSVAWMLAQTVVAFYCALRGAELVVRNVVALTTYSFQAIPCSS